MAGGGRNTPPPTLSNASADNAFFYVLPKLEVARLSVKRLVLLRKTLMAATNNNTKIFIYYIC